VSRLVIPRAAKSDSGMYSCSLSKHSSVLVHVHILNGKGQVHNPVKLHLPQHFSILASV
jgi:hypothetical protein